MASGEKPINLADLTLWLRDLEWKKVREMAIQLGFENVDLDDIEKENSDRQTRLSRVSEAWLRRDDKASWEKIVKVLKHIKENVLANELEKKYCKQSPSRDREVVIQSPSRDREVVIQSPSRDREVVIQSPSRDREVVIQSPSRDREVVIQSPSSEKAVNLATSSAEVQKMIDELEKNFELLKKNVRECIEKRTILMETVINALTQLSPGEDKQHKIFVRKNRKDIVDASTPFELFIVMNDHWNYLNPPLLGHLVKKLELVEVKDEMKAYNLALEQFRRKAPLSVFCKAQKKRRTKIPPDFQEMVAVFDWPKNRTEITLEVVENFREECAHYCNLHDCAMMISKVCPGSFIVNWFIPKSIVEKIKLKVPREILKKYFITKLDVAGVCVYHSCQSQEVSVTPSTSSVPTSVASVEATERKAERRIVYSVTLIRQKIACAHAYHSSKHQEVTVTPSTSSGSASSGAVGATGPAVAGVLLSGDAPKPFSYSVSEITVNAVERVREWYADCEGFYFMGDVSVKTLKHKLKSFPLLYFISKYLHKCQKMVPDASIMDAVGFMSKKLTQPNTSIKQTWSILLKILQSKNDLSMLQNQFNFKEILFH